MTSPNMLSDRISVSYVHGYDTDKPWMVSGEWTRDGQTRLHKTKTEAKQDALQLGRRYNKLVIIENKDGTVSDRRDYRDNSTQQKKQRSGGLFDSFF